MKNFLSGGRLLFDGAFGSYYFSLTGDEAPCELANLNRPDTVREIHRRYIEAGAQAIKTNTFGANTHALKSDFSTVRTVVENGFKLAKEESYGAFVFADIGPFMHETREETVSEYIGIADIFLDFGADCFLFETFPEYEIMEPVLGHIKKKNPEAFIIFSFAVSQDGYTRRGIFYKALIKAAAGDKNIDAVGLNCYCGPSHIKELFRGMPAVGKPASVMPNAGYPVLSGGRILYNDNASYFANKLFEISQCGAVILGGCCGTTPEHIKEASKLLKISGGELTIAAKTEERKASLSVNSFREKLKSGKKVIAVELSPPAGADAQPLIERARAAKDAGADLITFPDSPLSRARADSMMCAALVRREVSIDVLPHLSCRDRNTVGIKSILLAGKMENIGSVLALTGDPMGPVPDFTDRGVFSLHSINLISYIKSLNSEAFADDGYFIGAALNINAPNFEAELRRAQQKEKNGAEFFL
ncbi:MAG: homocysteine S-methyltransferase family protein, partial [Bacillota bacterium]|nr:homocysteine S-methyltransferase family protein [Bacillota bacterium]